MMRPFLCIGVLILWAFTIGGACSAGSSQTCGAEGSTQACVCTNGASGAQRCDSNGVWGQCVCDTDGRDVSDIDSAPTDVDSDPTPDVTGDGNGVDLGEGVTDTTDEDGGDGGFNATGDWYGSLQRSNGNYLGPLRFRIAHEGETLSGEWRVAGIGCFTEGPIRGVIVQDTLEFSLEFFRDEYPDYLVSLDGAFDDTARTMQGTYIVDNFSLCSGMYGEFEATGGVSWGCIEMCEHFSDCARQMCPRDVEDPVVNARLEETCIVDCRSGPDIASAFDTTYPDCEEGIDMYLQAFPTFAGSCDGGVP